ncbi:MAG: hydrolase, partial [Flavobacterium johnsoniae]
QAKSISENISIDGKINEAIWNTAPVATDFLMLEPDNGRPISPNKKTDVRILYNNDAIYVAAILYDDEPKKILKELTQRDNFGTADHFGIFINGFNDGQQDFRFFVSSSGVQMDCLATEGGEDYSWDAIWDSEVSITEYGWVVEMKIPYAALRFSNDEKQTWGLNFYREIKRDRQKYTWNLIDMKIGAALPQTGQLEGIENIKPPTRLFFIPYSSFYVENNKEGTDNKFKAGMDIKYGINDSFTLDAILVPDFGQTKYDNVVLNLGPFEQQFNENRPFFTEGTDLFNKGNLLYSRRIGGSPSTYLYSSDENVIASNPSTVNLINAIKISGRTSSGLGIGVLNAVTEKTYGTLRNTQTNETNRVVVEPLTNYNILVLDQRFNQNSSVALVNTNVTRNGEFRDANVSALVYDLNTKNNKFNLTGDFKYSYINEYGDNDNLNGINTAIQIGKKGGKWRYNTGATYVSKEYDANDLGITFINNFHSGYVNLGYRILNPNSVFNTFKINTNYYAEFQNTTGRLQKGEINIDFTSTSIKNDYYAISVYISPLETYDFYEARVDERFVNLPKNVYSSFYFSSNYNRKFALDLNPYFTVTSEKNRVSYGLKIAPRYRFSDKLLMNYMIEAYNQNSDRGWVAFDGDAIIFAERDRRTLTNELGLKYSMNPKMTLNLAARHYWSYAENNQYLTLQNDGSLTSNSTFTVNKNSNFSTWNFDLSYSWWFAPGSQISVLYRNNATDSRTEIDRRLGNNFKNLFNNNLNNILSISIRYFIDYNSIKNKF